MQEKSINDKFQFRIVYNLRVDKNHYNTYFADLAPPPLKQTIEEVYDEFQKGIILKEVDDKGVIIGSVRAYQNGGTVY